MTTTQHATFIIERRYAAPPKRVFAAWRDPDAKRAWFCEGEGWAIAKYELDFREGGSERSTFQFQNGPEIFGNETTFDNIVENERIVFTYSMDRNGVRFSVSVASVELREADGGTRLLFTEHAAHFESGEGPKMREAGWRQLLGKLDEFLTRGA